MSDQFSSTEVSSDDRLWAALGYVFSPLIPIIMLLVEDKKNRPFIRYHAVQSLAVGVVLFIVVSVLAVITFGCSGILWFIMLYWAYKSYKGEYVTIPVVSDFIKNQGWVA